MDIVAQMKKFMEPKSVALIGVPRAPRTMYEMTIDVLTNLVHCGYQDKIYPIHPQAGEIQGLKAYATVTDAPEDIDLAVINLPRELVPGIVRECVNKGIKAITILTQGFADADDDRGKQLQKEIDDAIKGTDARIMGPNTIGAVNAYSNFSSSYWEARVSKIPIGFICQTGTFSVTPAGLKIGKIIDLGNGSDVDFSDGLAYFEQDDQTKVIGLHIEGMRDGKKFLQVASRVARRKPIVALKTGMSERAARAAQSHTGSLAGKDEVWDVALKQSGVIRVSDVEELSDMVKAFCTLPLMQGRRIGIVTWTGGFGIMGIDACERSNLQLSELSPTTVEKLNVGSPSWQDIYNPADVWPMTIVERQPLLLTVEAAIRNLLCDPQVDAVLCILGAVVCGLYSELRQYVGQLTKDIPSKPLVFYFCGPFAEEAEVELEGTGKTLTFHSPNRAARALGHLADYSEFRVKF